MDGGSKRFTGPKRHSSGMVLKVFAAAAITVILAGMIACVQRKPVTADLSIGTASELISRAPEFNRYAKLLTVDSTTREPDSLADCCYRGIFTFQYINAPAGQSPIKASAEFRYYDRAWHFTHFDYGCPTDCHFVDTATPAMKGRTPY